jgi:hypothetical protein
MDFDAVLAQVHELLQRQGRVSYRALRLRFQFDDETLAVLKDDLIYAERVARDDRVLVWIGEASRTSEPAGRFSLKAFRYSLRSIPIANATSATASSLFSQKVATAKTSAPAAEAL